MSSGVIEISKLGYRSHRRFRVVEEYALKTYDKALRKEWRRYDDALRNRDKDAIPLPEIPVSILLKPGLPLQESGDVISVVSTLKSAAAKYTNDKIRKRWSTEWSASWDSDTELSLAVTANWTNTRLENISINRSLRRKQILYQLPKNVLESISDAFEECLDWCLNLRTTISLQVLSAPSKKLSPTDETTERLNHGISPSASKKEEYIDILSLLPPIKINPHRILRLYHIHQPFEAYDEKTGEKGLVYSKGWESVIGSSQVLSLDASKERLISELGRGFLRDVAAIKRQAKVSETYNQGFYPKGDSRIELVDVQLPTMEVRKIGLRVAMLSIKTCYSIRITFPEIKIKNGWRQDQIESHKTSSPLYIVSVQKNSGREFLFFYDTQLTEVTTFKQLMFGK